MLKSIATKSVPRRAPSILPSSMFHSTTRLLNTGKPERLSASQKVFEDTFGRESCGGIQVKEFSKGTVLRSSDSIMQKDQTSDVEYVHTPGEFWTTVCDFDHFFEHANKPKYFYALKNDGLFAQTKVCIKQGYGNVMLVDQNDLEFLGKYQPGK